MKKTLNTEHRTPNIEWSGPEFRVSEEAQTAGEVEAAESLNDFIHKLKVCLKELRETRRWLRLVARLKAQKPPPNLPWCLDEADELIRIFKASINTAEERRR
jgi:four helix bundle protein